MQCQVCKNNSATIHLTEIVEGQRNEMHLCETCAAKQGLTVKTQIPLNELLSSLLASGEQASTPPAGALAGPPPATCPECGITFEQFKQQSLLGCPNDYDAFAKQLDPVIRKSQAGGERHKGKVPSKAPAQVRQNLELTKLKEELEQALKIEDYELAAKLRDKIKELQ
jgi:protein arginine kinase activator